MSPDPEPAPPELSGRQRKWLRGQAHALKPVVHVGEAGLSEAVVAATDAALADHELIKVRLHAPADKKAAARELADATRAALCGLVGHTVVLFRPRDEDPRLEVPGPGD